MHHFPVIQEEGLALKFGSLSIISAGKTRAFLLVGDSLKSLYTCEQILSHMVTLISKVCRSLKGSNEGHVKEI